jgi:hypothetical protein
MSSTTALRLDVQEVKGILAVKDFVRAAGKYETGWEESALMRIEAAELAGLPGEDVQYYANLFRLRLKARPSKQNGSLFPTFNGKPEPERQTYECPCRPDPAFHKPEKCWLLQEIVTGKKGRQ